MTTAFDSLTSEGKSTSTTLFNYRTFMSISGLAPPHTVGMLVHQPGELTPGHAIGISPKWSYYVESDYLPVGDVTTAKDVRSQYLKAQASATEATKLQYIYTLADAALAKAEVEKDKAKNKDPLDNVAKLFPDKKCADDKECTLKELSDAKNDFNKNQLEPAQKAAKEDAAELDKLVSGKNIVITRWTGGETSAANVSVANSAKTDVEQKKNLTGIAIFTGLHTRFLFAGEDLLDMARGVAEENGIGGAILLHATGITTYVVMAEQVEYISDQELEQRITLGVSVPLAAVGKLEQYLKTLPADQSISLGLSHQMVSSLGNSGHLGNPTHHIKGFSFYPPQIHAAFLAQQAAHDDQYITVFAVRGELKLFETLLSSKLTGTDFNKFGKSGCNQKDKYRKLGLLVISKDAYLANEKEGDAQGNLKSALNPDKSWYLPAETGEFYQQKGQAACDAERVKAERNKPDWYGLYCPSSPSATDANPCH